MWEALWLNWPKKTFGEREKKRREENTAMQGCIWSSPTSWLWATSGTHPWWHFLGVSCYTTCWHLCLMLSGPKAEHCPKTMCRVSGVGDDQLKSKKRKRNTISLFCFLILGLWNISGHQNYEKKVIFSFCFKKSYFVCIFLKKILHCLYFIKINVALIEINIITSIWYHHLEIILDYCIAHVVYMASRNINAFHKVYTLI